MKASRKTDPRIKDMIVERSQRRAKDWGTEVVKTLPDPLTLKERTILGSYSYALQDSKVRVIREESLLELGRDLYTTPSAVARDYLYLVYGRGPKVTHEQAEVIKKTLRAYPTFAQPGRFDHGFYVDIKSTFWSVINIAGWDVDYWPGEWLSGGRPPYDFPFPAHKEARSCLVSVARPGFIIQYKPAAEFKTFKPGTPVLNLSISKLMSDVLNSVAADAIELGAVYANTDGYIAPDEESAAHICQMILDWGLEPRIKSEGKGAVKSAGAYRVGFMESVPYSARTGTEYEKNVRPPKYKSWLQSRFARLSALKVD